MYRRRG
jgi:dihydroxy-acid dehydratase